MNFLFLIPAQWAIYEHTQRRRPGNENGKKALAKQQPGTCFTVYFLLLLFISLPSLRDHDMKLGCY